MIKKPHILGLTLQSVQHEEEPDGCRLEREITDNSLQMKLQYAFEKPNANCRMSVSGRNSTGRLSAFDFLNVSNARVNDKKAFSITMNYFKNEKGSSTVKHSSNLYGFSIISSKIR